MKHPTTQVSSTTRGSEVIDHILIKHIHFLVALSELGGDYLSASAVFLLLDVTHRW